MSKRGWFKEVVYSFKLTSAEKNELFFHLCQPVLIGEDFRFDVLLVRDQISVPPRELVVLHAPHLVADHGDEALVVRDHHDAALPRGERTRKSFDGLDVEMVRRLIKEK